MAAGSEGYQCEFLDSVNNLFYCNKCGLVARRLCLTDCCGESYCHTCISLSLRDHKPCPDCKKSGFQVYEQRKFQQQIQALRIYCSLKKRGCDWAGRVDQLASHLDQDQGTCQYMDVLCPQLCHKYILKIQLEVHMKQECSKRPHKCQHCGFEDAYEAVVDGHLPTCRYVALQCPNICGVTCERESMEDHLKICRLQEVWCNLSDLGCNEKYPREEEEDHMRGNVSEHLSLTALKVIEAKKLLEEKCWDQEGKITELNKKLEEQERKLKEQEHKLKEQECKLKDQEAELEDGKDKLQQQSESIQVLKGIVEDLKRKQEEFEEKLSKEVKDFTTRHRNSDKSDVVVGDIAKIVSESTRQLKVRNMSKLISQSIQWNSRIMHSHINGYRFFLQLVIAHYDLSISFFAARGEHDEQLKWPVRATFGMVLVYANRIEGEEEEKFNVSIREWNRPLSSQLLYTYHSGNIKDKLKSLIYKDTLYFGVRRVLIQEINE